jgi:drug/metabolite transporter (DMT)-like permease
MKGMIYMAISAVFYSLMAFLLKLLYLHSTITAYEVTYWQSIIMVFVNYIWMRALKRDPFNVPEGLRYTLILRNIAGFLGITGYYLAIQYTDLSKAAVLYWTNPMFTALISACWLKEMLSLIDWAAIFVSFAGIIVI